MLAADSRDARIVPRGDSAALGAALSALMSDPHERLALGARARAGVERFRADAVLDEWERLIVAVLR
jgi:glycosyltransferase involved in cell wall biosynthesis